MNDMNVTCENCGCQVQVWNSVEAINKFTGTCTLCGLDIEVDTV